MPCKVRLHAYKRPLTLQGTNFEKVRHSQSLSIDDQGDMRFGTFGTHSTTR